MKHVPDGELMKAIARGNAPAFRELFLRHSSLVMGYGRRMVKDLALAEDVSQESWMKVVRAAPSYEDKGVFRAWLLSIVRRTALNLLRSRSRFEFITEPSAETENTPRENFEKIFSQQQELEHVKQLIEALPDQQRVALVIWLSEDMSYEDIAAELGLSVAAVKSLLFRARRTLEQQLRGAS
jgi:RNA polymerase sigma-70 factor (ECF subfamily)